MKYKNITKQDLSVPGVGIVRAGETAEMPEGFHNVNFEKVEKTVEKPKSKVEDEEIKNNNL